MHCRIPPVSTANPPRRKVFMKEDTEIEELVQVCLRAYDPTDISVQTLVGGDLSLLGSFFGASIRAGALSGKIYVATEAGDAAVIRGMALWWGPGAEPLSPEGQEWHRTVYRPDFGNLTEKLLGPRGKVDSWYLSLLAVEPDYQRRGVARALIDAVRAKASASGELRTAAVNLGF
ncbi:hypothetical protein B0H17DRAFT_932655 [Mycena rosella]|uniref:N-acetyltransferase domain-containing protein n=1 Tax=Mycena rosella TaxID=1033263 RepID=A0AAD7GJF4_MYCRO|nr:hypothetical protein B0H17DRAFT_932655 [Mycena rosella]